MVRGVLAVIFGLLCAVLVAVAAGVVSGLPFLEAKAGFEPPLARLARAAWPMLVFALPMALAAIAAAEARLWRSWAYWGLAGVATGLCGYWAYRNMGADVAPAMTAGRAPLSFAVMGLLGGLAYWWVAGRKAGALSAALKLFFDPKRSSEKGDRQRCALCAALGLLLGLVPLALLGWHAFHKSNPPIAKAIAAKAEVDAGRMLKEGGLPSLTFKIDERPHHQHIGHVSGSVADYAAKTEAFKRAGSVLAPMVGMPGVVAVLQDDVIALDETDPQVAAENARIRAAQEAANSLAKEAAAKKKAAEDTRLAAEAEAKRTADEEAAKKKAEDDTRLAAEAEAKRTVDEEAAKKKAEDDARLAAEAEAKRTADEEAASKKAEEDTRLAAEAEAKRKADEEAATKKAEEDTRLAAEAEAKRKADEEAAKKKTEGDARLKAEAEAKRMADEVAAKKKTEQVAEKEAAPQQPGRAERTWTPGNGMDTNAFARANCVNDFGQLFAGEAIRFAVKSAALESLHAPFLDKIGNLAKRCDGIGLLIEGNADAWGAEDFNQALSEQRAEAVRAALVERGVSSKQLATRGFGELRPLIRERSREADAANRRVDFGVVEIEKIPQTIVPKESDSTKN